MKSLKVKDCMTADLVTFTLKTNVVEAMERYCEHRQLRETAISSRESAPKQALLAWENQYWNKTLHSRETNNNVH